LWNDDGLKFCERFFLVFLGENASSQTVATSRIAIKICQGQPPDLAHIVPDFIQIGSLSAELGIAERVKTVFVP